jgi:hypothetical protein
MYGIVPVSSLKPLPKSTTHVACPMLILIKLNLRSQLALFLRTVQYSTVGVWIQSRYLTLVLVCHWETHISHPVLQVVDTVCLW